ncbi:hypothetical protein C0Z18_01845 [Trinickia dabaoshanensis]|uniref:Lipoprotein n=1 Tax=Trinickia dabaoshanensis TaxID=564714 RepID=A0A2N7W3D1_9BURK|nr:hypothetical protein [Trinickia dabaoshanensis]PMS23921.1 hypothetical protein C0Z18_01845 [Trinickia dabaoshanensis]
MNAQPIRLPRSVLGALCVASLATLASCNGSVCVGFNGCFDGDGVQTIALSGTAAVGGPALASATVRADCADGSGATVSDGNGNYSMAFAALLPCVLTATLGGTTLHSLAFAGGTFNTTPETDLMLVYLAAQLGTDTAHLIAGLPGNGHYQQVLESRSAVSAAQAAVVANLQQHYAVTLAAPSFLTTPFTVGLGGVDADLIALANAGAIDANGMPDAAAVSLLSQAGAANPL